jgi:hypothetical protein
VSINPSKLRSAFFAAIAVVICLPATTSGQKRHLPVGGRLAVVVEEHLSPLRAAPSLSAKLIERLSRGRFVAILARSSTPDGLTFYRVRISRRRAGWVQSEALISSTQRGDDDRLLRLIRSSEDFELIARARIFLEAFPDSKLRPTVLLLYGDTAEGLCEKLSREAGRRLDQKEIAATGAPEFSYFLNYNALDRYNRQNAHFVFDRYRKQFHYDGAAWREIVRRYPNSPEAIEARKRLETLAALSRN